MKALVLSVLMLSALVAFGSDDRIAPVCGLNTIKFNVSTTKQSSPDLTPPTGKALVYFIQDDTKFESRPRPTVRFAIDGAWVGATRANSWFALPVESGVHHVCADWQNKVVLFSVVPEAAAAHFTAQAGQTYYFRMRTNGTSAMACQSSSLRSTPTKAPFCCGSSPSAPHIEKVTGFSRRFFCAH